MKIGRGIISNGSRHIQVIIIINVYRAIPTYSVVIGGERVVA
jgi:hypothetical protein